MKKNQPETSHGDQDQPTFPKDPRSELIEFLAASIFESIEEGIKAKRLARIQREITHKPETHE